MGFKPLNAPVLVLVMGVGAIAVGCGGSSDEGQLTKAELSSKATAICAPVANEVNAALGKILSSPKPDPKALAGAMSMTVLPAFDRQTAALAELDPPSDLKGVYSGYLDSARQLSARLKADPSGPFSGDPRAFFGDSNAKAKAAGLPDVCLAGPHGR